MPENKNSRISSEDFVSVATDILTGTNEIRAKMRLGLIDRREAERRFKEELVPALKELLNKTDAGIVRHGIASLVLNERVSESFWGISLLRIITILYLTTTPKSKLPLLDQELRELVNQQNGIPKESPLEKLVILWQHTCGSPPDQQATSLLGFLMAQGEDGLIKDLPSLLRYLREPAGTIARSLSRENCQKYCTELLALARGKRTTILPQKTEREVRFFLENLSARLLNALRVYLHDNKDQDSESGIILFFLHCTFEDIYNKGVSEGKEREELTDKIKRVLTQIIREEEAEVKSSSPEAILRAEVAREIEGEEPIPPPPPKPPTCLRCGELIAPGEEHTGPWCPLCGVCYPIGTVHCEKCGLPLI